LCGPSPFCTIKAKVELKLSIPIGVIIEIKPRALHEESKLKRKQFFSLPLYSPNLAPRHTKKKKKKKKKKTTKMGGNFKTLGKKFKKKKKKNFFN